MKGPRCKMGLLYLEPGHRGSEGRAEDLDTTPFSCKVTLNSEGLAQLLCPPDSPLGEFSGGKCVSSPGLIPFPDLFLLFHLPCHLDTQLTWPRVEFHLYRNNCREAV